MLVQAIAFYLLAATTLCAGLAVISARNPVHSVLALIVAFFAAAGLFVLLGAEFLAMILVIVYVGAVAVLFLFVVMMLDVDFSALRAGFARYLPIGGAIAALLTVEMVIAAAAVAHGGAGAGSHGPQTFVGAESNTRAIGQVLYTNYVYLFEASGMVLLVAMIGAIVLTLKHRVGIKRQVIARQVARTTAGMRLVDIKPGEGAEVG